jgi:hypothetical protein
VFGQLVEWRLLHDAAQVGDGVEECFDFVGGWPGRLGGPQWARGNGEFIGHSS